MLMHISDEQLMMKAGAGDRKAFEELFQRYKLKLFNYLLRLSGDPHLAEDLFQETFLRLYRYAAKYQPLAKFSTFLYRIATNLTLNELKRRRKVPFLSLDTQGRGEGDSFSGDAGDISTRERSPDEHIYGHQLRHHLHLALAQLPEQMRITLLLSEIEGKKYEEIADILGCSVGTVKSRVNRARTKILKYFKTNEIM